MVGVLIKRGDWNNRVIANQRFHLVRALSLGQKGPFLTVNGSEVPGYPQRNFYVGIQDPKDFEIEDSSVDLFAPNARRNFHASSDARIKGFLTGQDIIGQIETPVVSAHETDEQIRARLIERFTVLQHVTSDIARGNIKGLVVSGASGVGKSHEVEAALNRDSLLDKLAFNADADDQDRRRIGRQGSFKARYNIVKGYSTAPALYMTLYEYSESRETLVFDDCDSVLGDETSLNLLKAALDTSGKRIISWKSRTRNGTDAPDQFEFKGSVIFITNINFEKIVEKGTARLAPHLEAIMSRCLYLDLTIDNVREKLIRIDHVARDLHMLEREFKLDGKEIDEVLEWTHRNAKRFRELSLRKVGQLASLRKSKTLDWERTAEITLLRRR